MRNSMKYDVIIIGAGAVGCSIARALSEFNLEIGVVEKEADLCFGISGRNSGVVHAGFNNKEGSLKAKFCVEGSRGFEKLAEELGVEYKRTGKLVTGLSENDRAKLEGLKSRGEANGVEGLEIIDKERIREISSEVQGELALWSPNTAVFSPFEYVIALAESAAANGVDFRFMNEVTAIRALSEGFEIDVNCRWGINGEQKKETLSAEIVINSAGLYSADVCRMLGIDRYEINPCRGEYHILERNEKMPLELPVYPVPDESKGVLGVHLTPSIGGNIMIGPSAEFLEERDDYSTTEEVMKQLTEGGLEILPSLGGHAGEAGMKPAEGSLHVIRSFSGIRPKLIDKLGEVNGDFVIEKSEEYPGFIYLVGIESPGITASLPIARYVSSLVEDRIGQRVERKKDSVSIEEIFPRINSEGCDKGRMICRCELVTEGKILQAFDNILRIGAFPTVKGIKNRTRAFMGNCQGGFCTVDTAKLLKEKRGFEMEDLTYDGIGSEMFSGRVRY